MQHKKCGPSRTPSHCQQLLLQGICRCLSPAGTLTHDGNEASSKVATGFGTPSPYTWLHACMAAWRTHEPPVFIGMNTKRPTCLLSACIHQSPPRSSWRHLDAPGRSSVLWVAAMHVLHGAGLIKKIGLRYLLECWQVREVWPRKEFPFLTLREPGASRAVWCVA